MQTKRSSSNRTFFFPLKHFVFLAKSRNTSSISISTSTTRHRFRKRTNGLSFFVFSRFRHRIRFVVGSFFKDFIQKIKEIEFERDAFSLQLHSATKTFNDVTTISSIFNSKETFFLMFRKKRNFKVV